MNDVELKPPVGNPIEKIWLGPLGWGVVSLLFNVLLFGSLLAWITGLKTLANLRKAAPETETRTVAVQAWAGILMGAVWPGALLFVIGAGSLGATEIEAKAAEPLEVVTMPSGHDPRVPLPVLVWLHGYGDGPHLADEPYFEDLADALGVAVLGIAAPLAYEDGDERGYQWTEDATRDAAHVTAAFDRVAGKLVPLRGQVVLFGFSQGAALAAEIAARDPQRYAGAIMMSPGTLTNLSLDGVTRAATSSAQRYAITVGAGEHPANLSTAETYGDKLQVLGAQVTLRKVFGQNDHSFPQDFDEQFPRWVADILPAPSPHTPDD